MADENEMNTPEGSPMEQTAKIDAQGRKTLKLKPIHQAEEAEASAAETVTLPAEGAAVPGMNPPTPTVAIKRPKKPTAADVPTSDIPMPGDVRPSTMVPSPASAPAAPASSTLPGVKQTIKLRPSTPSTAHTPVMPGISDAGVRPASAQTIKLSPHTASAQNVPSKAKQTITLVPQGGTASSSAQTIKLQANGASSSAPTIKLQNGSAPQSAQTIKLQNAATPQASEPTIKLQANGSAAGQHHKIGIKKHETPSVPEVPHVPGEASFVPPEIKNNDAAAKAGKTDEPNILFTICAGVALVVTIFSAFMMIAQYSNVWNGSDINVPGLERLHTK